MSAQKFVDQALSDLGVALKSFGTYSFDDKGPNEVMDLTPLVQMLRKMTPEEAGKSLCELASSGKHKGRGLYLAETLTMMLQDWDALFNQPGIDDIFNGERPGSVQNAPTPVVGVAVNLQSVLSAMCNSKPNGVATDLQSVLSGTCNQKPKKGNRP